MVFACVSACVWRRTGEKIPGSLSIKSPTRRRAIGILVPPRSVTSAWDGKQARLLWMSRMCMVVSRCGSETGSDSFMAAGVTNESSVSAGCFSCPSLGNDVEIASNSAGTLTGDAVVLRTG